MKPEKQNQVGKLYVVATPIGNLADFSHRAEEILRQVDLIAAEDTRHIKMLLQHYGISKPVISLHQHNEEKQAPRLIQMLQQGQTIALVSDAGTPLLSDPGMPLVKLAREHDLPVSPVPGACALIAALSVAGLPMNRFTFEGFLPRTHSARKQFFTEKLTECSTWAFYESSHRILSCLQDMAEVIEDDREVVLARELTKLHETIIKWPIKKILAQVEEDANMRKGEFVVIVEGVKESKNQEGITDDEKKVLQILLKECPLKTAVAMAVELTGQRKKCLYQAALDMAQQQDES